MKDFSGLLIIFVYGFLFGLPSIFPRFFNLSDRVGIIYSFIVLFFFLCHLLINRYWNNLIKTDFWSEVLYYFVHPLARIILLTILLIFINIISQIDYRIILLSGLTLIISISSIKWFPFKSKIFKDNFAHGISAWDPVRGTPRIENNFGNPLPGLNLSFTNTQMNSFLKLITIDTPIKGSIECDVYLEPNALFNIVFRANINKQEWYMARFDSRQGVNDGILKNVGQGWGDFVMSNTNSSFKTWHRMKIEFNNNEVVLFRDGNQLVKMNDDEFQTGEIGIFNEVGEVHIDNFEVKKTK